MFRRLGLVLALVFFLGIATFGVIQNNHPNTAQAANPPPTPAPPPTPGPHPTIQLFNGPYLAQPLTKQEAVALAYHYDQRIAVWDSPWSLQDFQQKSRRIRVKWYADRGFDGSRYGVGVETGPVWVMTITGRVKVNVPGLSGTTLDGVSYIIAQRTGNFLGLRSK